MAIRLSDNRCEEIKNIVVDTFVRLNICCVPISGFEIVKKLGVKTIPYSSQTEETRQLMMLYSEDGFTIKHDGLWYIFYNDEKSYGRTNNTLIHESAHIVLNHTEESDLAEAEANFFAKYAIAPPVLIHKLGLKDCNDVYDRFDISFEAAIYAYNYYRKWLTCGNKFYTDYELRLLGLFNEAV